MLQLRQAAILLLTGLLGAGIAGSRPAVAQGITPPPAGRFYCPMHPEITSTTEGRCSRCAMTLVPGDPLDAREYLIDLSARPRAIRAGQPATLTFVVSHPDTRDVVRTFATVHDRQFHLFIVSHDLEYYDHVHPEMRPDGSWTIQVTLPDAGYYKLIADFLPLGGTPQILPRLLVTANAGDLSLARARLRDEGLEKSSGSMRVALALPSDGLVAGREDTLRYHIVDAATGEPVNDLEPYLAAFGHTLVLSEDTLEYVHAHPIEQLPENLERAAGGPDLTFKAILPKPGRYRLWTQLKRGGVVTTARFTVTAASPVGR